MSAKIYDTFFSCFTSLHRIYIAIPLGRAKIEIKETTQNFSNGSVALSRNHTFFTGERYMNPDLSK